MEPLAALGVGLAAYGTAIIGGLAGYGTNLLMPLALVPVIGAAAAIPILAVSGMFNNASRLAIFRDRVEWRPVLPLTLAAIPSCFLGASLFTLLSGPQVALLLGVTLLLTVPLRRWLKGRRLEVGPVGIVLLGIVFGLVTGGTPGGGVVLTAALAALGLAPQAVIATDAAISLVVGLVKVATSPSGISNDTSNSTWLDPYEACRLETSSIRRPPRPDRRRGPAGPPESAPAFRMR